jgi:hypothetical protein
MCSSEAAQPRPDPGEELLSRLAVYSGEPPSEQAAAEAARAASIVDPGALRPDAIGAALAVCAERGHWDAVGDLMQVCTGRCLPCTCTACAGRLTIAPSSSRLSGFGVF